ncbi:MAG: hypothetical protein K8W52_39120 [Deltaproteobacteria bacterium]|nr:hypothetical protein [Deltaproteobacteria bacterium]
MRTLVLVVAIVAGASAPAAAAPQPDDAPLADGAAAQGAVASGAALIAEGEALGKAGKYEVALARFREAARAFPSATHDCYVALTYFRLGGLTAARLYLDSAHRRGDEVPGWCSGRLEDQLGAELARRGYVAVDIAVKPADAIVSTGDVRVVGGRRTWLPPGPIAVTAERAGYERATQDAAIPASAPASGVAITLQLRRPVVHVTPHRRWLAYATIVGGVALAAGGAAFHAAAIDQRDQANRFYADDPRFAPFDRQFQRDRALAIGGYVAGAAVITAGVYLVVRSHRASPPVEVALAPDRVMVSTTWSLGSW